MRGQGRGAHPTPEQKVATTVVCTWVNGMKDTAAAPPLEDLDRLKTMIASLLEDRVRATA